MDNLINIFTTPAKAFESLNEKPTWLVPLLIVIVFAVGSQYILVDISLEYQLKTTEARPDMTDEQFEIVKEQMSGGMKYIGIIVTPILAPIIWIILALVLWLFSKITISEGIDFKKSFSIVAWSSLVTLISLILITFLIYSKGTPHGVALDLSALVETPPIGEPKSVLYFFLSKIDPFILWQMFLWALGLSVMGKVDLKKGIIPVAIIWGLWVLISVTFGSFLSNMGLM
ncbi:MAG: YIP1 family protein [Calditrichaeota bacterium]|nr:MAG: YIP1 family protein [Calditrichota bacterium]MBL1204570.1 YIP1 family protein [Calditrichota bacterium]NOG44399.1 YIP1 family protein [Calditrichota bacterium]